jgi:hypothetical protein
MNITYTILPPKPGALFPTILFILTEDDGWTWRFEVRTDATGLCWKPGHQVLEAAITSEQALGAWREAMAVNDNIAF